MKNRIVCKNGVCTRRCNHAIAVHVGHDLEYVGATKFFTKATRESLKDECCGGVQLFNHCPFCGVDVRKIIEKIL